jgi:hypothetical protein
VPAAIARHNAPFMKPGWAFKSHRTHAAPHKRQKPAKEADIGTVPCATAMSLKSEDDIATRTIVSSQFEGVGVADPTP